MGATCAIHLIHLIHVLVAAVIVSIITRLRCMLHAAGDTSPLSPYFKDIIEQLFASAERNHGHETASVHIAAYEAVNMLVTYSARDTLPFVAALVEVGVVAAGRPQHSADLDWRHGGAMVRCLLWWGGVCS